ncbi:MULTISPECIES: hypothetical protein [unclassified Nocardiopsis]|uniref:hypothetical protein n=1 Tax=unclassified Nocardiopsis TaxID=2649073 RepID=UPI001F233C21|nr:MULTISPECIES: hypothetical protein [unclassified Nocardiopsis]
MATWLGTVALAEWLRRTGRPGPAEAALRRLVYAGTAHSPASWRGPADGGPRGS